MESNAVTLHKFWWPQRTLPCFGLQYSISKKTRTTVSLSSMQGVPSLRFVNRHGGTLRRAGWVAFTKTYSRGKWLKSHLPLTFAIIIHIPRPLHPCIWCPCVPIPKSPRPILDVLKSLVSRPQVPSPHTCVPMSPSPCPRPTFIHSQRS